MPALDFVFMRYGLVWYGTVTNNRKLHGGIFRQFLFTAEEKGKLLAGRRRARVRNRRAASPRSLVHNKDSGMFSYQNGRSRRLFTENGASARDNEAASGRSPGASAHARLNRDATPLLVGRPFNGGRSCSSK